MPEDGPMPEDGEGVKEGGRVEDGIEEEIRIKLVNLRSSQPSP